MQTVRDLKGKTIKVPVNWYFLAPFVPVKNGDMFLSGKQWVKVDNGVTQRGSVIIRNIKKAGPLDIIKDERAVKTLLEE